MKNKFKINNKGFWETETEIGHHYDKKIAEYLLNFLKKEGINTFVDFGCGMGDYIKNINNNSNITCEAYDGNPNTNKLTEGIGKILDLSIPFKLKNNFECVMSLEVGEHIPKEYEQIFIKNITAHSNNMLIISWAIKGQGGDGHVNCQNNDYIIGQIEKHGFKYNKIDSDEFRKNVSNAHWFKNTIMVFYKHNH